MPTSSWPRARSSRPTVDRVAHALERVVGVDEERAVVGHAPRRRRERRRARRRRTSPSCARGCRAPGCRSSLPASTFEVAAQPPMYAAREAASPPSMPCARRSPNSSTGSPRAAWHTRAALVAISVWKLTRLSSARLDELRLQDRPAHAHERLVREHHRCPRAPRRRRTVKRSAREVVEEAARLEQRRAVVAARGSRGSAQSSAVNRSARGTRPRARGRRRSRSRRRTALAGRQVEDRLALAPPDFQ